MYLHSLIPRPPQLFNVRATLKSSEWPGDEAILESTFRRYVNTRFFMEFSINISIIILKLQLSVCVCVRTSGSSLEVH